MTNTDQYSSQADAWLKQARSGKKLMHRYIEKPGLLSLIDEDLSGQSVLCLGVGSGEETEYYAQRSAAKIVGTDNSTKLIEAAKLRYPEHDFKTQDMEGLDLPAGSFDLVVSSLALHYLPKWTTVLEQAHKVLKPGGSFVFSTHNPVYWSAQKVKRDYGYDRVLGTRFNSSDRSLQVYGDYLNSKDITDEIISGLLVKYYHRPLSDMLNDLLMCDLDLNYVLEPKPLPELKKIDGNSYRQNSAWPKFIIFKLVKSKNE